MKDLKEVCKTLYLAYVAEHFEEIDFVSKEQFLKEVLSKEVTMRQNAKITRLMKKLNSGSLNG